jgi:hypothetical protein
MTGINTQDAIRDLPHRIRAYAIQEAGDTIVRRVHGLLTEAS